MELFAIFMVLCMATLVSSSRINTQLSVSYNVMNYGAVGDGQKDDSQAFSNAWKAVCGDPSNTPILIIPAGKTFLLKPVNFEGPCKAPFINVQVWGNIVAPSNPSDWNGYSKESWLTFRDVNGLTVNGNGKFDGQGSAWWKSCPAGGNCEKPTALKFISCDNLRLHGLKHINSQRNHLSIAGCNGAIISNLHITAPETSPNTDGIDIAGSTHIQILNCNIGTGDDCIAINSGSSDINITGVACGPGHGISIGSLGANGANDTVEEIHVKQCSFTGTQNGARIKTWQGGSGFARKISFEDITLIAAGNPIVIDQFYCPREYCKNHSSAVKVSDISYTRVHGTSIDEEVINFSCSKSLGCTNLVLDQINITSAIPGKKTYSYCYNAHGKCSDSIPNVVLKH